MLIPKLNLPYLDGWKLLTLLNKNLCRMLLEEEVGLVTVVLSALGLGLGVYVVHCRVRAECTRDVEQV